MKINFGRKIYWKYGAKKFLLYVAVGLLASNIPFLFLGMFFGSIPVFISALVLSITDTAQLISIDSDPKTDHHVVFSGRCKNNIAKIAIIFLLCSVAILYLSLIFSPMHPIKI